MLSSAKPPPPTPKKKITSSAASSPFLAADKRNCLNRILFVGFCSVHLIRLSHVGFELPLPAADVDFRETAAAYAEEEDHQLRSIFSLLGGRQAELFEPHLVRGLLFRPLRRRPRLQAIDGDQHSFF